MTDRELLELAAKAAGIKEGIGGAFWTELGVFDPLTDDGDALRLTVKLGLTVVVESDMSFCRNRRSDKAFRECGKDPYAATRRAIVRAAAEIGKDMK